MTGKPVCPYCGRSDDLLRRAGAMLLVSRGRLFSTDYSRMIEDTSFISKMDAVLKEIEEKLKNV